MDYTGRKKRLAEANTQQNPRIKSIRLSGTRLAVRIANMIRMSESPLELAKLSGAQSTVTAALSIVEQDFQRANKLLDMARSIVNGNPENKDKPNG